jgi:hypothetical protein
MSPAPATNGGSGDIGGARHWHGWLNWAVGIFMCVTVGCWVGANLAKGPKCKCGLDWAMAAIGSDHRFESMVQGAIKKSQADFEKQNPDLFKPAFEELDKPIDFSANNFTGFEPAGASFDR